MKVEPVELIVDGQKVRGRFYVPDSEPKKLAVLFLHGWTGKPNDRAAEFLARHGYYALTISYRGHNDSDGDINKITRQDSLNDALAAYDFLRQHTSETTKIVLVGNSYSGHIASLVSGERAVAGMSLRVPAAYIDAGFDRPRFDQGAENPVVMQWRQQPHSYTENTGLQKIHDFAGPIQIMEAEHDDIVPHQTVQNYLDAVRDKSKLEYALLKGWPHSMGDDADRNTEFQQLLLQWLQKIETEV